MKTKKNITKKNKSKRFTKKDYSSNDGMLTTGWGPGLLIILFIQQTMIKNTIEILYYNYVGFSHVENAGRIL